jgi:hypothetical protein
MIRIKLAIAIALAIVEITSCLEIAQAQLSPSLQVASEQQKPPVEGRPRRRGAAGTRGPCEETDMPFTPFLPETEGEYSGLTLREHPTFWFYVPYKSSSISSGEFAIADFESNQLYRVDFKLPETAGFVRISIPPTAQPLEKNKQYRWTFVLHCTDQTSEQPISHRGLVERGDLPSIEAQLPTASLEKQLNLYLENRIWYDAPADLAQIRNVPQAWLKLLRAMGLAELRQEAIAGSVVPIEP